MWCPVSLKEVSSKTIRERRGNRQKPQKRKKEEDREEEDEDEGEEEEERRRRGGRRRRRRSSAKTQPLKPSCDYVAALSQEGQNRPKQRGLGARGREREGYRQSSAEHVQGACSFKQATRKRKERRRGRAPRERERPKGRPETQNPLPNTLGYSNMIQHPPSQSPTKSRHQSDHLHLVVEKKRIPGATLRPRERP